MRPATPPSAGAEEPWLHLRDDVERGQFGFPLITRGGLTILDSDRKSGCDPKCIAVQNLSRNSVHYLRTGPAALHHW